MDNKTLLSNVLGEEQLLVTLEGAVPNDSLVFSRQILYRVLRRLDLELVAHPGDLSAITVKCDERYTETRFILGNSQLQLPSLVAGKGQGGGGTLYLKGGGVFIRWSRDMDFLNLDVTAHEIAQHIARAVLDAVIQPAQA